MPPCTSSEHSNPQMYTYKVAIVGYCTLYVLNSLIKFLITWRKVLKWKNNSYLMKTGNCILIATNAIKTQRIVNCKLINFWMNVIWRLKCPTFIEGGIIEKDGNFELFYVTTLCTFVLAILGYCRVTILGYYRVTILGYYTIYVLNSLIES